MNSMIKKVNSSAGIFIWVLGIAFLVHGCGQGGKQDSQSGQTYDDSKLVWADEFNYEGAPNPEIWTYDIGHGWNGWGNNELQYYTDKPENVRVEDGKLIIEALKENGEWTSARIKTLGLKSVKYGTVVARAKIPEGVGTWPAIWMLGEDFPEVSWPKCGEIDIMEHVGKDPNVIHSALHTPSSHGNTVNSGDTTISDVMTNFHEYSATWTKEEIIFKVDGKEYYRYKPEEYNDATWPFNKPFFVLMNIAIGGNWGSKDELETDGLQNGVAPNLKKARMEVDYIRYYEL